MSCSCELQFKCKKNRNPVLVFPQKNFTVLVELTFTSPLKLQQTSKMLKLIGKDLRKHQKMFHQQSMVLCVFKTAIALFERLLKK